MSRLEKWLVFAIAFVVGSLAYTASHATNRLPSTGADPDVPAAVLNSPEDEIAYGYHLRHFLDEGLSFQEACRRADLTWWAIGVRVAARERRP